MARTLILVIGFAAAGQSVAYVLAIVLARHLGVTGFEAYVVASAIFILLVAVAPGGLDKFAIRLVPTLLVQQDFARLRGFLRFGVRRTLALSFAVLVVAAAIVWWRGSPGEMRTAIVVTLLALPAGALAHFGFEALTGAGREALASAILRVGVPSVVLVLVGIAAAMSLLDSGAVAVGAWGVAWVASLVVLYVAIRRILPDAAWQAPPRQEARTWTADAFLFWVHRVAMAVSAQASVIALELLQPSAAAVSGFAAGLASIGVALTLVTTSNRIYARRLSVLLETGDVHGILALFRARLRWLLPSIAVFLVIAVGFADWLMSLFGRAFVEAGTAPLRLLALTAAFTMLLALAPTYLKYTRQSRTILWTLLAAVAAQIGLLIVLVPQSGATGAAVAYAAAMVGMYCTYAVLAWRDLRRRAELAA